MEAEFFRSLDYLLSRYELPPINLGHLPFPQNVSAAYAEVSAAIRQQQANVNCLIIKDEQHRATLALLKTYDTGRCLYYIPVRPLWNLSQSAQQQPLAELLLSVYAYLYQVAHIPFYTGEASYLDGQYDSLQNWIDEAEYESGEDQAYADEQRGQLLLLRDAGNRLMTFLRDKDWVGRFEARLGAYRQTEGHSEAIAELASRFLQLYAEYPTNGLFDHIRDDLIAPEETERIRGEQYISFYWSGNDCLCDMLFEMVNNDFQECGITDEPVVLQLFDSPQTTFTGTLDFENRLFGLISQLCELLNPYDHN